MAWKREGCPPFERPPDSGWAAVGRDKRAAGESFSSGGAAVAEARGGAGGGGTKRRRGGGAKPSFAVMIAEPQV